VPVQHYDVLNSYWCVHIFRSF